MSEHISEDIAALLTGDASRETVLAAAAHLRQCADCQQELVSAVVAHASLTSAQRFAPEIVARREPTPELPPLPDLTPVFEQIREESARPARRPRRALLAVAAALIVGVGSGVAVDELASSSSSGSSRTVSLAAYPTGSKAGSITIVDGRTIKVDATKLARLDADHVYELWVTDGGRTKMAPIGLIDAGNRATLTANPSVMAKYSNFEVSVQSVDQTSNYSGKSVLRGAYN